MKKTLLLVTLFISICVTPTVAQTVDTLTNQSVIDMVDMGFDQNLIISKIETSVTKFNTSMETLKELKNKNVSNEIIISMVKTSSKQIVAKTGIFYLDKNNNEIKIHPTVFSGTKTRTLASAMSYGIASAKIKSTISNAEATTVVNKDNIKFKFYFDPNTQSDGMQANNWWFKATSSPQEFVMVELKVNEKKNYREITTGKANAWVGTDAGIENKSVISFDIKEDNNGVFTVTTKEKVQPGQYCFFYKGTAAVTGYTNQSVFDFSVE